MVRPRLPPLNAIKACEAAAPLGSFTRAAEELNVTHGAVSRQIRMLEDWLGARLFVRTIGDGGRIIEAGSEVNWPKIPPSGSIKTGFVKPNSRILPAIWAIWARDRQ